MMSVKSFKGISELFYHINLNFKKDFVTNFLQIKFKDEINSKQQEEDLYKLNIFI